MESRYPNYKFEFDRTLKPGSVSVMYGNGGFEDNIDQRIAELAQQLLNYAPSNNHLSNLSSPNNHHPASASASDTEVVLPNDSLGMSDNEIDPHE